jgi:hypothetical protein
MRLLRLDLTRRGHVEDFELFETSKPTLDEFAEMLLEQEQEHIFESTDDPAERATRLANVDYCVHATYVEFTYDGGFESRFYLVDTGYNTELLEAAVSEIIHNSDGFPILGNVFQKKLQKS